MDVNLERFHQTFFDESVEHLASMEAALLELEGRPDDDERLNAIFRGAHSIKGASGTFGFTDVAQFTHTLESLLDRLRHHQIVASAGLVDLLLRATDMLRLLIAAARQGETHLQRPAPSSGNSRRHSARRRPRGPNGRKSRCHPVPRRLRSETTM